MVVLVVVVVEMRRRCEVSRTGFFAFLTFSFFTFFFLLIFLRASDSLAPLHLSPNISSSSSSLSS